MNLPKPLLLFLISAVLALPSNAWALANCYIHAQKQFQSAKSIAKANLIPADRWLAMTKEQRKQAGHVEVVSAVNDTHCRRNEILAGGIRVTKEPFGVPFGYLYELAAQAVIHKNKKRLRYLSQNAKPANKNVDALFALYKMPPPSTAGGWSVFSTLSKVYQLKLNQGKWLKYGLMSMFKAMGGEAVHDCKPHTPPASMINGVLYLDPYKKVLSFFGLSVGHYPDRGNSSESHTFILQGCVQ